MRPIKMMSPQPAIGGRDLSVAYYHANQLGSLRDVRRIRKMHGPRRVITFCLLTAVLPTVLLVIPLYLRHSVYADVSYEVTESDVLEIVEGISTIFCQEHSLKMNTTFSAFQLESEPEISPFKKHVHMKKSMALPDDTIEYWGFYLLEGSTVILTVCSRYDGGRLMLVRGERNLKTCGLLNHRAGRQTDLQGSKSGGKEVSKGANVRVTLEKKLDGNVGENRESSEVLQVPARPSEKHVLLKGLKDAIDEEERRLRESPEETREEGTVEGRRVNKWKERKTDKSGKGKEADDRGRRISSKEKDEDREYDDPYGHKFEVEDDDTEDDDEDVDGDEDLEGSGRGDVEFFQPQLGEAPLVIRRKKNERARTIMENKSKALRPEKKLLKQFKVGNSEERKTGDSNDRIKRSAHLLGDVELEVLDEKLSRAERLKRLKGELDFAGDEMVKRRGKREEVRLVDTGLKHGGTALNYTKQESEEDSNSSFEIELKECYGGLIEDTQSFDPSTTCIEEFAHPNAGKEGDEASKNSPRFVYDIKESGYYYYIFYSDNDLVTNELRAAFDIRKSVFEYGINATEDESARCINATECTFKVGFLSGATVMVEIPTRDGIDRDIMDEVGGPQGALLISSCHPRMSVYIIFPIAVLFLILGCAFL